MKRASFVLFSLMLATASASAASLALPQSASAASCAIVWWAGPYLSDDHVQGSVKMDCSPGPGGAKVELRIIKSSTGSIEGDNVVGPCPAFGGCNPHTMVNVDVSWNDCTNGTNTTYYMQVREKIGDGWPWEAWRNSPSKIVACSM